MVTIKDGRGNGNSMGVNANKQALVYGTHETSDQTATEIGDSYNINTGLISMSGEGYNALIYFKNNETEDVLIDAIAAGVGLTSGVATDSVFVKFVSGPTAGDIISNATSVDMNVNRNFGSANTLADSLAYKGTDGGTLTGGSDLGIFQMSGAGRLFAAINMIVPPGKSCGMLIDMNGVTANVYAALVVHKHDPNEE